MHRIIDGGSATTLRVDLEDNGPKVSRGKKNAYQSQNIDFLFKAF